MDVPGGNINLTRRYLPPALTPSNASAHTMPRSRRSARSGPAALSVLASIIAARLPVLLITGAGVSVASGIPAFRTGAGAVWSARTRAYGTRAAFERDPLAWYNAFWLAGVIPWARVAAAVPNPAHAAVAALAAGWEVDVVTQNIDELHCVGTGKVAHERLVRAHGRAERYRCVYAPEEAGAGGAGQECVAGEVAVDLWEYAEEREGGRAAGGLPGQLKRVPVCGECGVGALRPACLMFDEDYAPNRVWGRYAAWAEGAAAVVFAGSSNAVGITADALRVARRRGVPVFNFNVGVRCMECAPSTVEVWHVLGPAEETLPELVRLVREKAGQLGKEGEAELS